MKNTLKKLIAVILALTVISGCFVFSSSAVNSEYLTYTVKEDGTAELKKCSTKAEGAVVVPSVVIIKKKSYDVTSIGDSAFEKCSKVTSVSVSEGIKSIGARAFADCTALTDVYVPQTLSLCQYNAFRVVIKLRSTAIHQIINFLPFTVLILISVLSSLTVRNLTVRAQD
ncbi:MAG: leucine-rich repeat protein [Acutalibacteraceae bacterium]|nr:leucine-rich repeat protein [Acutalibacteraceae bacterium]